MKNADAAFLAEFDKSAMRVGMSVEIEFGNNRFNSNQVCTATSTKDEARGVENAVLADMPDYWKPDFAFNNKNHNVMKWLVCDAGAELEEVDNGATYRCLDLDAYKEGDYELGWWSQTTSNGSGVFATPQTIQSLFYDDDHVAWGRKVNTFAVYFDEAYPNMGSFSAWWKDNGGTWHIIWDEYTLGDDEYEVRLNLSDVEIYGLKLTVHSTSQPNDWARVSEFNAYFSKTFTEDDYIVNADINEVREQYEGSTPIGITGANTFDVELDNSDGYFSINGDSELAPYLIQNCRVVPYINANGHSVQMGEYWTDEWNEDGSGVSVNVNCRDFSKFLQEADKDFSRAWSDTNPTIPFVELLTFAGFPYNRMDIQAETSRIYPVIFLHDQSMWELFGELGLAERLIFNFDYLGNFVLSNSYIAKPEFYDDFVRDVDREYIGGSTPTRSQNYKTWSDVDESIAAVIKNGVATTDNIIDTGRGVMWMDTHEFYLDVKVAEWNDSGLAVFAGATDASSIMSGTGLFVDATTNSISAWVDGVPVDGSHSATVNDDSIFTLKVTSEKVYGLIDGVQMFSHNLGAPFSAGYAGFQLVSPGSEGTPTELASFSVRPIDKSVMSFDGDVNLESGSTKTDIWTNEVVVKLSEFSKDGHGTMRLWGPDNPTILSYARLQTGINATDTTIHVEREVRQENGSLIDNGWPKYDGLIWIPKFSGGEVIGGELIKYTERTVHELKGCQRGYLGTKAQSWSANTYLGEAREWDVQFDGSPALEVKWPFVTAIDVYDTEPGYDKQAYVVYFDHDAFGGKLVIGNIAKYLTWLEGTGQGVQDFDDKNHDIEIDHATSIAGIVANSDEAKQKVIRKLDDPTAKDKERIRRYGRNKVELENQWIQSREHAQAIADEFIAEYKTPRFVLNITGFCAPVLELGDRVTIASYEQMNITNIDYHVVEIKSSYDGGLSVELVLREVPND